MGIATYPASSGLTTSDLVTQPQWVLLGSSVGTASVSSVTFSSIPQTYRTLKVLILGTSMTVSTYLRMRFNGNTGTVHNRGAYGEISNAVYAPLIDAGTSTGFALMQQSGAGSGGFAAQVFIENYSSSTEYKPFYGTTDYNTGYEQILGHFGSTTAITSIEVFPQSGNMQPNAYSGTYIGMGIFVYGAK